MMLTVIIIEKNGTLKQLNIKEYKEEELYKKCGFKKAEDFLKQTTWKIKYEGQNFAISLYGKTDGKAGNENKYEFPPPVDSKLFFGSCILVGQLRDCNENINLTIPLWTKLYEKLYGGFEDLTEEVDSDEEDVKKKSKKVLNKNTIHTEVISGSDTETIYSSDSDNDDDKSTKSNESEDTIESNTIEQLDCGSELEEEEYDYDE
jgi:hypothetical protein